ncbi:hypothetical protein V8C42DRAFT_328468 [Trichoderma barbatum]
MPRIKGVDKNMDDIRNLSLRKKLTQRLASSTASRSTLGASNIFKDKALVENALRPRKPRDRAFTPRQTLLSCFLQLPPELQFKVLSYLDYGEIQRLRQTCRLFRESIDDSIMLSLFPMLVEEMLGTCYICLTHKGTHWMIKGNLAHQRFPMTSKCFDCIARRSGFIVGQLYQLVCAESVFVCRWCGIPVSRQQHPEFHNSCYPKFKMLFVLHGCAGGMQWIVVIVGSALCWHYFRHQRMIMIPVVIAFIVAFWALILGMLRGAKMRTYHWSMLMEVIILALWIPPTYALIDGEIVHRATSSLHVPLRVTIVILVFVALNMMCRILNFLGHLIMFCGWKFWRRSKPGTGLLKRMVGMVFLMLVGIWADPKGFTQEYPGRCWFRGQGQSPV